MKSIIKKIDVYILKKFLLLFAGSFCVCLFVLIMQFLWRYVDDLVGKGISFLLLVKFFWYASLTLIPTALPLAILLASLISFGNMGEQLELTALKSAGVPLKRIMSPVGIFSILLCVTSFVFQNNISPKAQHDLTCLIATMKVTSPVIEIPEGVFYNGIPNVNIYVQKKNASTGMLYQVIIYKVDQGPLNAQIVLADSARLETTEDKHFLKLSMYNGEQFENLQAGGNLLLRSTQVPYDRETFKEKILLIDFNSEFDLLDATMFAGMARVKNLKQLDRGIDSIQKFCDSLGVVYYEQLNGRYLTNGVLNKNDAAKLETVLKTHRAHPDSINAHITADRRMMAYEEAQNTIHSAITDLQFEKPIIEEGYHSMRKHKVEWHQKFALSLACIIFFFIGAPFGAIIRKGGLGMPTVASVAIFVLYYIINTSGMKMARDGNINMALGMWVSTMVLAPLGAFLTYKANNDSEVFNVESYLIKIRHLLGIKTKRYITRKEVIINDPIYQEEMDNLQTLTEHCQTYSKRHHLPHIPHVFIFFRNEDNSDIIPLHDEIEEMLKRLSNSRDTRLLYHLNKYPEINPVGHIPFREKWLNLMVGILFPIGMLLWIRMWRFRIQLYRDLRVVEKCNEKTKKIIGDILSPRQYKELKDGTIQT